jgi:hypothetical protein
MQLPPVSVQIYCTPNCQLDQKKMSVNLLQPEILLALSESKSMDLLNPEMEVESRVSTDLMNPSCISVDQDPNPVLKFTMAGGGNVVPTPGVTRYPGIETEREKFPVEKEKETICRENPRVEVEEVEKEEEERHWCCEWCDENVEHLQEQIWQLHKERLKETKCGKTDFSNWNFFRKEFFRRLPILKMFLSVKFRCQRTWLGCMMGWRV